MDYKKAAEELFEWVLLSVGVVEDVQIFNYLCDRYPELMDNYVRKIEEEAEKVDIEWTEEDERRNWEKLCKKIRARFGEDAI